MKSFYLLFVAVILSVTAFAKYATPGTFKKWNLDSLVLYSGGTVTFSSGSYNVNDTLFISQNDTLFITTNVTVKFAASVYIDVNGTILVNPPLNATFTAQNTANAYLGMRLDSTNSSVLRKLTFEYAIALRIADCSPLIDSCIFRYNNNSTSTSFGTSAITLFRSNTTITNTKFLDNQRAAISGGSNINNAPKIIGCVFMGNNTQNANVPQINLGASGTDTVRIINNQILRASTNSGGIGFLPIGNVFAIITGNTIKNNRYGLTFNGGSNITALVSYNQVDSNNTQNDPNLGGSGIAFSGGSATSHQNVIVTGNLFRWNLWGITIGATSVSAAGGAKPNLGNIINTDTTDDGKNIFVGNTNTTTPNIDLYNNNVDSIFAQNNYWDVQEGSSVEAHIFHKPDNAALGFVNYLPLFTPLPIKLSLFTGNADKLNAVLRWQTATENNSDYFAIEKSTDGRAFSSVGKITASGNSSAIRSYQFTDVNALQQSGLVYYRLKLVDKDGKFTYSGVVAIQQGLQKPIVQLYPTVITASQPLQATITSPKNQTVVIRFYNAAGSLLYTTSKALLAGTNTFAIMPDKALPNGQLYVKCIGETFTKQVLIIKE